MITRIAYILSFLSFFSFASNAQSKGAIDYTDLLKRLEVSISQGEKRSLRDLGSLLDHQASKEQALHILRKYSLFTKEEIDLNQPITKARFHSFYYDFEHQIQFSDIIGVYFISPLEARKTKHKIKPFEKKEDHTIFTIKAIRNRIDQALEEKNQGVLLQQIEALNNLNSDEVPIQLVELSQQLRSSSKKWSKELYNTLCKSLAQTHDLDALKEILNLIAQKDIDAQFAAPQLLKLTNLEMKAEVSSRNLLKTYRHYIDSLGTIEEMRTHGYDQVFNFQPNFFNHIVDYYGRILCFADGRDWLIHNAVQDLIATQHPRSLFYLAAMGYKNSVVRQSDKRSMTEMINIITGLTSMELGVENVKESIDFNLNDDSDPKTLENYLSYWAASYDDYEWDEAHGAYVNRYNALEKTQNYEKLFRRLNSRNDSVAMVSFAQLTEGEPAEIVALAEKYRQMFRSYNQSLPPFKYKYLEQLSALTHYCKKFNIVYKPDNELSERLNELYEETDETRRYKLENQIIQSIQLDDITPLEYWGCLNQSSEVTNYSLGRILDVFYSKNWKLILDNDLQLRLYLKKSKLLSNIGVIGVCNNYLNKFNINKPSTKTKLIEIQNSETDRHILNQITLLISSNMGETNSALSDFMSHPLSFNKRDIKILPPPNQQELAQVIKAIQALDDKNAIRKYFYYLRLHPDIEQVPLLYQLAKDDRILLKRRGWEMTVADNVTPILENIFNFNFPTKDKDKQFDISPWNELWEKDKANFRQWPNQFFEQKIKHLETLSTLSIDDINLITESPNYEPRYKHACLEALKKVTPVKDIRTLNIQPKLSIKSDLKYFEELDFSYKVLDDIPKLFEIDEPSIMLSFLIIKSDNFDISQKGSLFNNLFRYPWFTSYIHSGQAQKGELAFVEKTLNAYLSESDYLSEFEEQTTTLHLTQLQSIGMPLQERLSASIHLNVDNKAKAKIQETIISTISYKEISIVAQFFNQLESTPNKKPWDFLQKDFGLPIFNLNDQSDLDEFMKLHQELSEFDFYTHYLQLFGIDYMADNNELDYQKIYDILQFDAVTPFVAGSGGKRDYYTYGIIKILELKFGTSLGFHEKLNENQSFYSFSTAKRSKAWIDYLIEQNLIQIDETIAPSFTQVIE